MSEAQPTAHQQQKSLPIYPTQKAVQKHQQNSHSSFSYIQSNNNDPNHTHSQVNSQQKAEEYSSLPFDTSISDVKSGEMNKEVMVKRVQMGSDREKQYSNHSDQQEILVKTNKMYFQRENLPVLKKRKPSFSKPYTYRNNSHYNTSQHKPNYRSNNNHGRSFHNNNQRHPQEQPQGLHHYRYNQQSDEGEGYQELYNKKAVVYPSRFQTQANSYEVQQQTPNNPMEKYNDYLNYYMQHQQIQQINQQSWINSLFMNPYQCYHHFPYNYPLQPFINHIFTNNNNQIAPLSPKQPQLPKNIGSICLPKFQLTINNCILSISCCKLTRLKGDILLIPFYSIEEYLYPGLIYNDYWSNREQVDRIIKSIKEQNMRNGELQYHKTQKSSFSTIAFVKVARIKEQNKFSNNKDDCFITSYNRGLHALLTQAQSNTVNPNQPCKEIVIPYTFGFGTTKQKISKIVNLLRLENSHTFQKITINCSDIRSFRRMVDSMSHLINDLNEQSTITF